MDNLPESHSIPKRSHALLGNIAGRKWILFGCLLTSVLICIVIILFVKLGFNITSGPITITDARMASGVDKYGKPVSPTNRFKQSQDRIYCIVTISAPKPITFKVKWYQDDNIIFEDEDLIDGWRAFYIQSLPGYKFPKGNYRVEIFLLDDKLRTIPFTIE